MQAAWSTQLLGIESDRDDIDVVGTKGFIVGCEILPFMPSDHTSHCFICTPQIMMDANKAWVVDLDAAVMLGLVVLAR